MVTYEEKVNRKLPFLFQIVALAIVAYTITFAVLVIFQRNFLYVPNDVYLTPQQAGVDQIFEEIVSKPKNGDEVKGWYSPARARKPTIILFHGNADSIRKLTFIAQMYITQGYGFVLAEYRGYSGFKGTPTEEGLYADARGFIDALIEKDIDPDEIVLLGHSLGTGVATQMALEYDVAGLMLLAPFQSVGDRAQELMPYFFIKHFIFDQFDSISKVPQIGVPLLIVHGEDDVVIPVHHGQALYDAAKDPKAIVLVPRGGHNDLFATPFVPISMKWMEEKVR